MLIKKTQKFFNIVFYSIFMVSVFVFVISQIATIQNMNNTSSENNNKNNTTAMEDIKEIYIENKNYFDLVANGFSDRFELMAFGFPNGFGIENKISGMYYMESSKLTVYEYINYEKYTYGSLTNNIYFSFSQEQIDAFYYIFNKLDFEYIEFFLYNNGTYNLLFKKNLETEKSLNESSETYFMYGLSFSSENAPNEYYYEDEIFEEKNWKYAFWGYV